MNSSKVEQRVEIKKLRMAVTKSYSLFWTYNDDKVNSNDLGTIPHALQSGMS